MLDWLHAAQEMPRDAARAHARGALTDASTREPSSGSGSSNDHGATWNGANTSN